MVGKESWLVVYSLWAAKKMQLIKIVCCPDETVVFRISLVYQSDVIPYDVESRNFAMFQWRSYMCLDVL